MHKLWIIVNRWNSKVWGEIYGSHEDAEEERLEIYGYDDWRVLEVQTPLENLTRLVESDA